VLPRRLRAKPVRTASGIAVVAVMSKPHRCPHIATTGNICVYCPGGPDSDFEYSTQSYTGYEPTSMRAIRARYNPYVQARSRVDQLQKLGHIVDKVWQGKRRRLWTKSQKRCHACQPNTREETGRAFVQTSIPGTLGGLTRDSKHPPVLALRCVFSCRWSSF
jgi:hypothetical protein